MTTLIICQTCHRKLARVEPARVYVRKTHRAICDLSGIIGIICGGCGWAWQPEEPIDYALDGEHMSA